MKKKRRRVRVLARPEDLWELCAIRLDFATGRARMSHAAAMREMIRRGRPTALR